MLVNGSIQSRVAVPRQWHPRPERLPRRRGALLLLVLSMLTLFLMIGILLLMTATRTRVTARAFSEAMNTTGHGEIRQRELLDEALMRLIRGPAFGPMSESILEDAYGREDTYGREDMPLRLVSYSGEQTGVIQATIVGLPPLQPFELAGRIVTFRPNVGDNAVPSSYRILSAAGNTFRLANMRLGVPTALPRKLPDGSVSPPCRCFINGRAFTPSLPRGGVLGQVVESYADLPPPTQEGALAQTRGDGLYWTCKQGQWRQLSRNETFDTPHTAGVGGTPPLPYDPWLATLVAGAAPIASFSSAAPRAVVEVDNDNDGVPDGIWLTGLFPDEVASNGGTLRHSISYTVIDLDGRANVNTHGRPPGAAAASAGAQPGPADVDCAVAFGGPWVVVLQGGPAPERTLTTTERRPTPWLSLLHYRSDGDTDRLYDVFGKVSVAAAPPNPYALDVGPNGPRPMLVGKAKCDLTPAPKEAAYGVGELERILRPFDADASALPPRLAVAMGPGAEQHRLQLTTDSWDTGGLSGWRVPVMFRLPTAAPLPSDICAGLRFDLNTPVGTDAQRLQYFNTFMSLLMTVRSMKNIAETALPERACAQWVANVVDFLDSDNGPSTFKWQGIDYVGLEPSSLPPEKNYFLGGAWNLGRFASEGELLAITFASLQDIQALPDTPLPPPPPVPATPPPPPPAPLPLPDTQHGSYMKEMRRSLIAYDPSKDIHLLELLDFLCVTSPYNEFATSPYAARWREPGRLNVNTCTPATGPLLPGGVAGQQGPVEPPAQHGRSLIARFFGKQSLAELADISVSDFLPATTRPDLNRLLNTATTRSNVFAIWITLRTENTMTGDRREKRLFAIIDRSIPVGFLDGADLNAADIIRLKRHLD
jgi:hypothetical protein